MKRIKSVITIIVTICILATIGLPTESVFATTAVKVQTYNSQSSGNQIYTNYNIVNTGSSAIDLTELTVRYYFTGEATPTTQGFNFYIDYTTNISQSDIVANFNSISDATDADTCLELTFKGGTLSPNAAIFIQSRISKSDWTNFDNQSNDYSYNGASGLVDWDKVTAHISGVLAWGTEPYIETVETIQNLRAIEVDAVSVKLNWTPLASQMVEKYAVYRNGTLVGKTYSKTGYFSDFGLKPLSIYNYKVVALNSSGKEIGVSSVLTLITTNEARVKSTFKVLALAYDPVLGATVPARFANNSVIAEHYINNMANKRVSELGEDVVLLGSGMWPTIDLYNSMKSEFNSCKNMQRYKDQFIKAAKGLYKMASNQTIDFEFYNNQVITLNEYPPAKKSSFQQSDEVIVEMACAPKACTEKGCTDPSHNGTLQPNLIYDVGPHDGVDYQKMVYKQYPEFGGNSIVDLIEMGEIDAVWFVGGPPLCGFAENPLLGNRNIGLDVPPPIGEPEYEVFRSDKSIECSRSFFFTLIICDYRVLDANTHMFEGIISSISDANRYDNWPRNITMDVYATSDWNSEGFPVSNQIITENFNLWGRFRTADQQGTRYFDRFAVSSPGNANVGSSHFPPNSIRGYDYAWQSSRTWQADNYVSSCADDWYSYPNLPSPPNFRMIGPYDMGAYNSYIENTGNKVMSYYPMSYHVWWLSHLPHNPGVNSDGILNNWWYYIYDFNRFDGSRITYQVTGFPDPAPTVHNPVNNEYGTEQNLTRDLEWGYWHSHNDSGKNATLTMIDRSSTEGQENVKYGNNSLKAEINCSRDINGNLGWNELFYPVTKNAAWDLTDKTSISFSIKPGENPELINGTNPVVRLCMNSGNKIEYVPKVFDLYRNFFFEESDWNDFIVPLNGNALWEVNIIGYINPALSEAEKIIAKNELKNKILENVNYIEIAIGSTILTTDSDNIFSIYLDGLKFN